MLRDICGPGYELNFQILITAATFSGQLFLSSVQDARVVLLLAHLLPSQLKHLCNTWPLGELNGIKGINGK